MALLLTSFAPWRAHQASNAADDLVALLQARQQLPANTLLMRHLPVHFQLAPCQVITTIFQKRPAVVVCCGMAEQRSLLNLEQSARWQGDTQFTSLNLPHLIRGTHWTALSDDAGDYVCNYLYFRLLSYIQQHRLPIQALFVHVPLLTDHNRELLAHDFTLILSRLADQRSPLDISAA
jgi:pyroglutamyl-peptidase